MIYIYIYIYIYITAVYGCHYLTWWVCGRPNAVWFGVLKQYIGATEGTIKQRIYGKLFFSNRNYSTNTSLSTHICLLKGKDISPTISWEILKLAPAYSKSSKNAFFACMRKSKLSRTQHKTIQLKQSEILSKCRHENKPLLAYFDPNT